MVFIVIIEFVFPAHWILRYLLKSKGASGRLHQMGKQDQAPFLNQALEIDTTLSAIGLLETLLEIEKALGRLRIERWAERTIDIDILYYSNEIINLPKLEIPHPRVQARRFAFVPMVEIAPDLVHPLFQKTQRQLLASCLDELEVKLLNRLY